MWDQHLMLFLRREPGLKFITRTKRLLVRHKHLQQEVWPMRLLRSLLRGQWAMPTSLKLNQHRRLCRSGKLMAFFLLRLLLGLLLPPQALHQQAIRRGLLYRGTRGRSVTKIYAKGLLAAVHSVPHWTKGEGEQLVLGFLREFNRSKVSRRF